MRGGRWKATRRSHPRSALSRPLPFPRSHPQFPHRARAPRHRRSIPVIIAPPPPGQQRQVLTVQRARVRHDDGRWAMRRRGKQSIEYTIDTLPISQPSLFPLSLSACRTQVDNRLSDCGLSQARQSDLGDTLARKTNGRAPRQGTRPNHGRQTICSQNQYFVATSYCTVLYLRVSRKKYSTYKSIACLISPLPPPKKGRDPEGGRK